MYRGDGNRTGALKVKSDVMGNCADLNFQVW